LEVQPYQYLKLQTKTKFNYLRGSKSDTKLQTQWGLPLQLRQKKKNHQQSIWSSFTNLLKTFSALHMSKVGHYSPTTCMCDTVQTSNSNNPQIIYNKKQMFIIFKKFFYSNKLFLHLFRKLILRKTHKNILQIIMFWFLLISVIFVFFFL
jgi:hypothetical protein